MNKAKRIIVVLATGLMMLSALCTNAQAKDTYSIRVESNPIARFENHIELAEIMQGGTYTFDAKNSDSGFMFWKISGRFETIEGDYTNKTLTIRPQSDIIAVATYEETISEQSPREHDEQTSENMEIFSITLMVLLLSAVIYFVSRRIKK